MSEMTSLKNCLCEIFRYDSTTGTFTVPPGGDGYYYFSTYLYVVQGESGSFDIIINGEILCTAETYHSEYNDGPAVCGGAIYMTEGL